MTTIWLLARCTGFIAVVAATIAVVLGALAPAMRGSAQQAEARAITQRVHRSAAVLTLVSLVAHVALLVIDTYVDIDLLGALVPFTAGYEAFATGLGTVALWLLLLVAVSGALRGRLAAHPIGARAWRGVHLTSYGVWVLAIGHGLLVGTDTTEWWALGLYAGCVVAVGAAVAARVTVEVDRRRTALALARSPHRHSPHQHRAPDPAPAPATRPLTTVGGPR